VSDPAEQKRIRLHRSGGSRAAVIPSRWLERHGIAEDAVLYDTDQGIVVAPPKRASSVEDEPEFALFLDYLSRDALAHADQLVDPGPLLERAHGIIDPHRRASHRRK
jgi:hypothetical protein